MTRPASVQHVPDCLAHEMDTVVVVFAGRASHRNKLRNLDEENGASRVTGGIRYHDCAGQDRVAAGSGDKAKRRIREDFIYSVHANVGIARRGKCTQASLMDAFARPAARICSNPIRVQRASPISKTVMPKPVPYINGRLCTVNN